jgi:hypothetical protein
MRDAVKVLGALGVTLAILAAGVYVVLLPYLGGAR